MTSFIKFVALRPKMYSVLEASGASMKKAKGVQKITVKKDIRHEGSFWLLQGLKSLIFLSLTLWLM